MPCTQYVPERSLLIDGLSAGAKVCLIAAVIAVVGCKQALPAPVPDVSPVIVQNLPVPLPVVDRSCDPFLRAGDGGDTLRVVSTAPISPSDIRTAPTAGHRFVLDRAYQTVVRVDCAGHAYPSLALSWSIGTAGQTTVTLRPNARFWSGDRVTATEVVAAWRASADSLAMVMADSSRALDDSTLVIHMRSLDLRLLSSPRLAVTRPVAGSSWPEGSGTHRLMQSDVLMLKPVQGDSHATYVVRSASPLDARNLIDDGIDILLTGDSATAAYASRRLQAPAIPLAWDRTWMLLVPGAASDRPAPDSVRVDALRDDLVRDAVRSNARRATNPPWISHPPVCFAPVNTGNQRARIGYRDDEPIARAIAERLVALGSPRSPDSSALASLGAALARPGSRLTAGPLSEAAFAAALRSGSEAAVVFHVPHHASRACSGARTIPLVDTRWQTVIRPGATRAP